MDKKKEAKEILTGLIKRWKDSGDILQSTGLIKDNVFYADIETTLGRHLIIKLEVDILG